MILLVAKHDRRLRIEVGYGLEGAIPDARAKRIIERRIVPRLKGGDFVGGVTAGVDALIILMRGEELPSPIRNPFDDHEESVFIFAVMGALFGFVGLLMAFMDGPRRFSVILGLAWLIALIANIALFFWPGVGWPLIVHEAIFMGFGMLAFMLGMVGGLGGGSSGGGSSSGFGSSPGSGGGSSFSSGGGSSFSGGGGGFGGGGASGSW